ncbi:hypothetical protein [Levilactobacillus tujiorum]|uniref:hypothetical protein n=1 Tax=Levilactobacillus tujiorum TaxID=2912243 RepID=UPI0014571898|nr:hypothetical protein [Levilactobacillus tujiorum]NLR31512.1 hypothetical protein [Levilactobacillus tujiorum]
MRIKSFLRTSFLSILNAVITFFVAVLGQDVHSFGYSLLSTFLKKPSATVVVVAFYTLLATVTLFPLAKLLDHIFFNEFVQLTFVITGDAVQKKPNIAEYEVSMRRDDGLNNISDLSLDLKIVANSWLGFRILSWINPVVVIGQNGSSNLKNIFQFVPDEATLVTRNGESELVIQNIFKNLKFQRGKVVPHRFGFQILPRGEVDSSANIIIECRMSYFIKINFESYTAVIK